MPGSLAWMLGLGASYGLTRTASRSPTRFFRASAGFIMIALGAILLLLPLANWQVNLRGRRPAAAVA
jgi:hypothetical protein